MRSEIAADVEGTSPKFTLKARMDLLPGCFRCYAAATIDTGVAKGILPLRRTVVVSSADNGLEK